MVEDGLAVAKDEIDIALDEATIEVLACAGTSALGATSGALSDTCIESVLVAEYPHVLENVAIAAHQQGHGLRALLAAADGCG